VRFADVAPIRRAVAEHARHLRGLHPEIESIKWFGSWVNGTARPGSDVDLCVVVRQSDKRVRDRVPDFLPERFPVGIDLFIYTPAELDTLRTEHSAFAAAIDAGTDV